MKLGFIVLREVPQTKVVVDYARVGPAFQEPPLFVRAVAAWDRIALAAPPHLQVRVVSVIPQPVGPAALQED